MLLAVISMNGQNTTVTRQPSTKPATTIPKAEKSIQKGSGSQTKTPHKTSRTQQTKQSTSICTDNNHPHAIDLGLPSCTKWACCNVGAVKPEASGGYFAWGETKRSPHSTGKNTLTATAREKPAMILAPQSVARNTMLPT